MSEEKIRKSVPKKRGNRTGFTTGACAAAAAKAATMALVTGEPPSEIECRLPNGQIVRFPVHEARFLDADACRAVGRAFEMQVAETAIAALGQQHALAGRRQVGDHGFLILFEDLGPDRHAQDDIVARGPGALRAHAMLAGPGKEMLLKAEIDQRVQPLDRLGPDIAATPAIAAIGAAIFDEFLAAE